MGGFCILKVEFYVEATYYHPEYPTPSVVIVVRNNVESLRPSEPIIVSGPGDMKDAFKKMFMEDAKTHKTSFLVSLEQYRQSGISVGDRLSVEISINNKGEIQN